VIYQAVVGHELQAALGAEWAAVEEHSGMAEIAGITKRCLKAWSRRSTRLREWAANNLVVVDGEPSAQQLAAAQKATRPAKPESQAWAELTAEWRADARGVEYDRAAHLEARAARRAAPRLLTDRARLARPWWRASTSPRSPARTSSSWWARCCPSTCPGIRARSSNRSWTPSGCG
jgi:TrwC relaxase